MNKKTIIRNVILVLTFLLLTIFVILKLSDIKQVLNVIHQIDIKFIIIACFVLIVHWLTWGLPLYFLIRKKNTEINKSELFLISNTDLFFNGITPFSSGGQPFQLYGLVRSGSKASDATSGLIMSFIIHQLTVNILCIFSLVYYSEISSKVDTMMLLIIVGFLINFVILFLLITASVSSKIRNFYYKIFDLLCKIKFINKFIGTKKEDFVNYIEEFQTSFKELCKDKLLLLKCLLFRCICMIAYNSIPYIIMVSIMLSLNIEIRPDLYFYTLSLSVFNFAVMSFIPVPGAAVGAEIGLQTLLLTIVGVDVNIALATMLVWRFLTYYVTMVYGFIMYLIYEHKNNKKGV